MSEELPNTGWRELTLGEELGPSPPGRLRGETSEINRCLLGRDMIISVGVDADGGHSG